MDRWCAVVPLFAAVLVAAGCADADSTAGTQPSTTTTVALTTDYATSSTTLPTPTTTVAPTPTGPMPIYLTTTNPLTAGGELARVPCTLPAWPDDNQNVAGFFDVAMGCLDHAWQPVLDKQHLPFAPAKVVLTKEFPIPGTAGRPDVACGRPAEENTFYCDGTIYLAPGSYLATSTGRLGVPAAAIGLLAHEYGHHVQRLSGILPATVEQIGLAGPGTDLGLELSRRVELQAQCFAGLFVGATFDQASVDLVKQDNYTRGDSPGLPPDHGSPQTFGDWFATGARTHSLAECNTWAAPPAAVR